VGRILILLGAALIIIGVLATMGVRIGRLPGDLVIERKNTVFYFPLMTCLLLSLVLTVISWLFSRR
jgi:hypothetical protein